MKKIGVMFGKERSFPEALIERINSKQTEGITAEPVRIDKVMQGETSGYAVIFDRISQDVPFYRAFLKNTALAGTAVINNPFWWSADEKFFNNALATKIGVPVPKTVILPSYDHPADTTDQSFSNLAYPMDWPGIFEYVGFPAYMKPFSGGGWKNVYRLDNLDEFYQKHGETGELVMLLQEEIQFDEYYRCYCIGGKHVRIMPYEPRNPHHLRYQASFSPSPERYKEMEEIVLKINQYLGYDFNTVELALRDGVPYAIDFCNPAPDADLASVGQENFDWVVETAANYAIERAQAQVDGKDNLTWGKFVKHGSAGVDLLDGGASSGSIAPVVNINSGADSPSPVVALSKAKKPSAKKDPSAPKKGKAGKPAIESPAAETEEIPFKEDAEAPNEGSDAAK